MPKISGPKRTISVGKFDAIGAFTAKYGNWDIGGGLSAMMTTALIESGQFIVVERANLQQVLSEQELKTSRLTNPNTGPTHGKIIGVQHLVYGSVTEFGAEDKGSGFSIGGSGGGIGNLISGALSTQSASGNVTIDVRLVDTTTGQVIETHTINQPISSSGFDVSLGYRGINMGTNQFDKTPWAWLPERSFRGRCGGSPLTCGAPPGPAGSSSSTAIIFTSTPAPEPA
jgi:curli biogenesis system outer membrane secretion channel CsgG